jgi:hypothetical protein
MAVEFALDAAREWRPAKASARRVEQASRVTDHRRVGRRVGRTSVGLFARIDSLEKSITPFGDVCFTYVGDVA